MPKSSKSEGIVTVSAGVLFIDPESMLCLGTHATGSKADLFGIPKGIVEQSESAKEAAIREVAEEIGPKNGEWLSDKAASLIDLGELDYLRYKRLHPFVLRCTKEELEAIKKNFECVSYFDDGEGHEKPEIDKVKLVYFSNEWGTPVLSKSLRKSITSAGEKFQELLFVPSK